jgi:bifunctional NMN adenylyltransferase/nudix hydrolase
MKILGTTAVVVGRFQVPKLHLGHRFLIEFAASRHDRLLIVLGVAGSFPTPRNPLSFEMREAMIKKEYPHALIVPLPDCPSDEAWSKALDELIERVATLPATLYGSRKSFFSAYSGKFPQEVVPSFNLYAGSKDRERIAKHSGRSEAFRRGVIYTQASRHPIVYPTVDTAILSSDGTQVLLAAKEIDGAKRRFVGGFVDTSDLSLEQAAKREVIEETSSIEVDDFRYVGSARVRDWRYLGTGDEIMTTLFRATYVFGAPRAQDDIISLEWIPLREMMDLLVDEHKPLGEMLLKSLNPSAVASAAA